MADTPQDPPSADHPVSHEELTRAVKKLAVLQLEAGIALEQLVSLLTPEAYSSPLGQKAKDHAEGLVQDSVTVIRSLLGTIDAGR